MTMERENPSEISEHEKKNEGGRQFGHVHDPSQAQQASRNQGLADDQSLGSDQGKQDRNLRKQLKHQKRKAA